MSTLICDFCLTRNFGVDGLAAAKKMSQTGFVSASVLDKPFTDVYIVIADAHFCRLICFIIKA